MAATLAFDDSPFDRRAVLRAGLLGGAAIAVTAAEASGVVNAIDALTGSAERATSRRAPRGAPAVPTAAGWSALVGHEVVLTGDGVGPTRARVLDVRSIADPSASAILTGEAYSVLFAPAPAPPGSSAVVTVHHERLGAPTLVIMPVNGDGSWEAVVDRRTPIIAP